MTKDELLALLAEAVDLQSFTASVCKSHGTLYSWKEGCTACNHEADEGMLKWQEEHGPIFPPPVPIVTAHGKRKWFFQR